jgi:Arsenite efflux pump ACR3 and related permeases
VKFLIVGVKKKERSQEILDNHGDNFQLFFLCLAVVVMFASQGDTIVENPILLLKMLLPLGVFFTVNFIIAQIVGKRLHFSFDDTTALTFTTLARNSPLALAIAAAAFPESPLILLVLVIGPLIELPVLSLVSSVLLKMREKTGLKA